MKIKKILAVLLTGILALSFAACGNNSGKTAKGKIVVGATPVPHAAILEAAKEELLSKGYELEIKEFTDYVQPNSALANGDIDANFFQHLPYLEDFNQKNGTDLVSAGAIHYEPLGIYPGKSKDIKNIKSGAVIAVPNDTTNEARALLLLESQGIIKLKKGAGLSATKKDIVKNTYNVEIKELEAAQIARSLEDVDFGVINGNYALDAGLTVDKDALAAEDSKSKAAKTYENIIAVKSENKDSESVKALVEALKSETVQKYIKDTYKGNVVAR